MNKTLLIVLSATVALITANQASANQPAQLTANGLAIKNQNQLTSKQLGHILISHCNSHAGIAPIAQDGAQLTFDLGRHITDPTYRAVNIAIKVEGEGAYKYYDTKQKKMVDGFFPSKMKVESNTIVSLEGESTLIGSAWKRTLEPVILNDGTISFSALAQEPVQYEVDEKGYVLLGGEGKVTPKSIPIKTKSDATIKGGFIDIGYAREGLLGITAVDTTTIKFKEDTLVKPTYVTQTLITRSPAKELSDSAEFLTLNAETTKIQISANLEKKETRKYSVLKSDKNNVQHRYSMPYGFDQENIDNDGLFALPSKITEGKIYIANEKGQTYTYIDGKKVISANLFEDVINVDKTKWKNEGRLITEQSIDSRDSVWELFNGKPSAGKLLVYKNNAWELSEDSTHDFQLSFENPASVSTFPAKIKFKIEELAENSYIASAYVVEPNSSGALQEILIGQTNVNNLIDAISMPLKAAGVKSKDSFLAEKFGDSKENVTFSKLTDSAEKDLLKLVRFVTPLSSVKTDTFDFDFGTLNIKSPKLTDGTIFDVVYSPVVEKLREVNNGDESLYDYAFNLGKVSLSMPLDLDRISDIARDDLQDNTLVLENHINVVYDLKGKRNITIKTNGNGHIFFWGDNSAYEGLVTFDESVKRVDFMGVKRENVSESVLTNRYNSEEKVLCDVNLTYLETDETDQEILADRNGTLYANLQPSKAIFKKYQVKSAETKLYDSSELGKTFLVDTETKETKTIESGVELSPTL